MRFKYVLGLACGLGLATMVSAQTTPAPTPARSPAQTGQTILYPTPLYRMNDVGKSLNLTPDQINSLNVLTDQTQARYRSDYAKLNNTNAAERAARLQRLNQQYYSAWNKGARTILNDNQRSRYQEMNYQYGGFNSLSEPDVQTRMNLTVGQVNGLRAQEAWSNKQLQDINRVAATDSTKAAQMYRDYLTQRQARLDKFLTPEQRKTWRQITGEPYTFQPSFAPSR